MKRDLKKIILFACLSFFATQPVVAQKLVFLFGHVAYNKPVESTFKDNYNLGLGAEVGAGIGWNKTFITGTLGINYFRHTDNNQSGNVFAYPVKLGLRQYLIGKTLYLHGDAGIQNVRYEDGATNGCFSADAGIGAKFLGIEVQFDYDGYKRPYSPGYASWIGIKAGYSLGL